MGTARRMPLSRRRFLSTLGAAGCLPLINRRALAQQPALPLANLGLETVVPGPTPRIARFGIKVAAYDHGRAAERLRQIGAEVLFE